MIPQYEATGAAIASTFSYALSFALAWLFYGRVTGRRGAGVLVPTRSKLSDYRALQGTIVGRARSGR